MRGAPALLLAACAVVACGEDEPPNTTSAPTTSAGGDGGAVSTGGEAGTSDTGGNESGGGGAGASGGDAGGGGQAQGGAGPGFCGDGIVQADEGCDDGNHANDDSCPDDVLEGGDCQPARCGDGHVWSTDGGAEACDDGNDTLGDDCPSGAAGTCVAATCDDGFWHHLESGDEIEADCGGSCAPCTRLLLLSEAVFGPPGAAFFEIHNPSATAVALDGVYVADYADYYLITQSTAPPESTDFRARFPTGAMIAAGERVVVSVASATDFESAYGFAPDYDFDDTDAGAPAMLGELGATARLGGSQEMLVLFHWDGASDLVGDIDYLVWGNTSAAMDKSNVTVGAETYAPETATVAQSAAPSPPSNQAVARCLYGEGGEATSGGNGLSGADETSEDYTQTWAVLDPTPGSANACPFLAAVSPVDPVLTYIERTNYTEVETLPIVSDAFDIVGAVAVAEDPGSGAVYVVLKDTNTIRRFARLNPATGVAHVIAQPPQALSALAFDPAGALRAMTGDGAQLLEELVTVNPTTVALTSDSVLQTGACCGEALTLNPDDGLLYRFTGLNNPLMQSIDPVALTVTAIPVTGDLPQEITGVFWDAENGYFVAFDNALSVLTVLLDGTTVDTGITLTKKLRGGLIP